jgi:SAM-dependent methyltransferase
MGLVVERATAGGVPPWVRFEHLARYRFAAGFSRGKTVVDCACGDGTGADHFAAAGATAVFAFDNSPDAVALASSCFGRDALRFAVGDATRLPVADATADLYVSLETIEHLPDDAAFLADVVRVLRPGGTFICSTPNRTVTYPGATLQTRPWNPFHVREYTEAEFVELLGRYFGRVELYGQNRQSGWYTRLAGWLGRRVSGMLAVRVNQILKLPRFVVRREARHAVVPHTPGCHFEYLVAVCGGPRPPTA